MGQLQINTENNKGHLNRSCMYLCITQVADLEAIYFEDFYSGAAVFDIPVHLALPGDSNFSFFFDEVPFCSNGYPF